jgi:phytoene dehydrogenase-like protein
VQTSAQLPRTARNVDRTDFGGKGEIERETAFAARAPSTTSASMSFESDRIPSRADVVIVGAGHNALVAAVMLAKAKLDVVVLEQKSIVGGAARVEKPFHKAPNLGASTGAYLLGVMPPELIQKLGLELELCRRDPHYFLPTQSNKYLMFGSNKAEMRRQFVEFFSENDWKANEQMNAELAQIREDVAPAWMAEPLSVEETAEKFIRKELRQVFVDLVKKPVRDYLARFPFESDLIRAMYATTDGFSGLHGGWDTPGTGHNFLVHNMCRLPGGDGTFMIVKGGMGMITQGLAKIARAHGAKIVLDAEVASIDVANGAVKSVTTKKGDVVAASTVVSGADPFRTNAIVGSALPADYVKRIDAMKRDGTTMKVNLAFDGLPTFSCVKKGDQGPYGPTIHILPDQKDPIGSLRRAYESVCKGELADEPTIEWYFHTPIDPSLRDAEGHHNGALFVQWVPYTLAGGKSWSDVEGAYVKKLLALCDRFAPDTSARVLEAQVLTPPKIESYFGITRGHIHHVDNGFALDQRAPYALPVAGLYQCSAGTHPAGSVLGCGGHNAANVVLKALGR